MIEAKNKFREGFIILKRPFLFAELKNPLQKYTILWAYSEKPVINKVLTEEGENEKYFIASQEDLANLLEEEGYHTIVDSRLKEIKEFRDRVFYLSSRGVPKSIAERWSSISYKDLVIYKPYFDLLDKFCRSYEIHPDRFYEELEGADFSKRNLLPKRRPLMKIP